jgi:hypothetical protein
MATQAKADELEQALGEISETVEVKAGKKLVKVVVKPFGLRQLAHVLKCVKRLREAGVVDTQALKGVADADDAAEAAKGFDMVQMFLDGGDEVINIIQVAVGNQLQAHELDKLNLVDGARLASAVFAVNLDFFYQNRDAIQAALAPAVSAIEKVMQEGVEALGQPPSTDS